MAIAIVTVCFEYMLQKSKFRLKHFSFSFKSLRAELGVQGATQKIKTYDKLPELYNFTR